MDITQKITLDLDRRSVYTTICAKQGDTKSRKVQITLVSGGAVYKPPSGAGAKFRAQKPDGTMVLNPAVVNSDGTVTVELTRQTIAVPGEVTADVYLADSVGAVLSSASFVIRVEPAPNGVQADSENEFLHLVALVERAESASTTAGKQAQAAATSAQQAQEAERSATQILQGATTHAGRRDNPHGVTAAQVGAATNAALNAHTGNRSNPHGVTAAQIGAAPAGFGLGADAVSVDSWDNATKNGFYRSSGGSFTGDAHGIVVSYPYGEGTCDQLAWSTWNNTNDMATRRIYNGIPREWEYINPPMQVGIEYRTTDRYMRKPVYTQLVNFGLLPQNSQASVKIPNPQEMAGVTLAPIRAELLLGGGVGSQGTAAGYRYPYVTEFYTNSGNIIIKTNANDKAYARVQVWYTKIGQA